MKRRSEPAGHKKKTETPEEVSVFVSVSGEDYFMMTLAISRTLFE